MRFSFFLFALHIFSVPLLAEQASSSTSEYSDFEDVLSKAYEFLSREDYLPQENRYGVVGVSTFAIEHALTSVVNRPVDFVGGKEYRPWVAKQMEHLNQTITSHEAPLLQIVNMGYLAGENEVVHSDSFLVVDASWLPQMQKKYQYEAPVYIFNGSYLSMKLVNVAFAFFEDEVLAQQVQERLIFQTSGVTPSEVQKVAHVLGNPELLKRNANELQVVKSKKYIDLKNYVKRFNQEKHSQLDIHREPTGAYAMVSGEAQFLSLFLEEYPGTIAETVQAHRIFHPRKEGVIYFHLIDWNQVEELIFKEHNFPQTSEENS